MQKSLTIVAHARAKPGMEDLMIREQTRLVEATKQAKGCIRYELHRSNNDTRLVTFVEEWASAEDWRSHMESPAIQAFRSTAGHCIGDFSLFEMHQVA
ncbi:putative quinol monooxygenase [Agrobacterium pusense]|uniref:putative quinol monooxygenase n=1 Tax=Agrobacterium pusense TaxID=648995 RepID=UPI0021CEC815|nr:antibiotic biosynthesis monooxygenase family protein [Agrobacterium pusense]UXT92774.1 antibiotic biosynthesis monooxygenase [Agrobacterium pusense]